MLPRRVHRAIDERRWLAGLTVTFGACNIFLGVYAFGAAGVLGILGGLAVCAALIIARRNHRLALDFLAIGALPFAIATWWSRDPAGAAFAPVAGHRSELQHTLPVPLTHA